MGGGDIRSGASGNFGYCHWLATFLLVVMSSSALASDDAASRILYFEPLRLIAPASTGQQKSSASRQLQFDAYGRRFVVTLERNDKLSPLLRGSAIELYRGQVNDDARSWARLSFSGERMQGMLWDGAELYVIEPLTELRDALPASTEVDENTTAIFRLTDVAMTPGSASCGAATTADVAKGSDAYNSMVGELKGAPIFMQAIGATRRLELSVLGDALLLERFGTEARARDEILARLNNIDGIYSSQLQVQMSVASIDFRDSLSATTSASSLLDELSELRRTSPDLRSRGLTHLFTGRDLDGSTVGIAFIDSICSQRFGAGLTEASNRSRWIESLIAAHEIGHNFGAPHDGEGSCSATPRDTFLMSPSINGNDQFSSCSLSIMLPRANGASCITALSDADIEVDANLGSVRRPLDTAFDWQLNVRNVGGLTTADARAEIVVPSELTILEAFVTGGTCTSGGGLIACELGPIAGGNSTAVQLMLRSSVAASHVISATVSASNDSNLANNQGTGTIATQAGVDLGVSLQVPGSSPTNSAFTATLTATNNSQMTADAVVLTLTLPNGVTASSATFGGTNCSVETSTVTCTLASLAGGASASGSVTLTASTSGTAQLQARISSDQFDPVPENDMTSASITSTMPTAQTRAGGGGGGGSSGAGLLALLLAALGLKSFQRQAFAR
jgi:hypothetical protein